jgi:hypothetical protein
MTPHIPEELSTRIDWRTFAIMSNTMPPEILMMTTTRTRTKTKKRTEPTNRRSCASRMKTKNLKL